MSGITMLRDYPDTSAGDEPDVWDNVRKYGYRGQNGRYNTIEVPFAGIAEMCDRVREDNWTENLDEVLFEYNHYKKDSGR